MELPSVTDAVSAAGEGPSHNEMVAQAVWRKSSFSTYNGNCIEVAQLAVGLIGVRDTKNKDAGPVLVFDLVSWRRFLGAVKDDLVFRA